MKSEVSFYPKVRIAVTVDDLFLWKRVPWPSGHCPETVVPAITEALARHELHGVYSFSATAPAGEEGHFETIAQHWLDAGNLFGNHTHNAVNLDWVSAEHFVKEIEQSATLLAPWLKKGGPSYFRYPFQSYGNEPEKRAEIEAYLKDKGYRSVPIDLWFYDAEFIAAQLRFAKAMDEPASIWLARRFVETALEQLQIQVALSRTLFSQEPIFIWRIHATPLAGQCLYDILAGFRAAGVVFVSLEEAMTDPLHRKVMPESRGRLLNCLQRWALHDNLAITEAPPSILKEVEARRPMEGLASADLLTAVYRGIAEETGGTFQAIRY